MSAALKLAGSSATNSSGERGTSVDPRMRAAKDNALDHLMDAVKAVVSTIRTPGRRSRERMTAAKLLMQFCEGGMASASSDSVDSAVRVLVVDQSQLGTELAKRMRSV